MAGTLTTGHIPNAVDRRVRTHYLDTYPTVEPKLEKVFKIKKQEDYTEYEEDYQGLAQHEATSEGETYKLDNFGEAYQTTYTPTKYTKRVAYTMESQMWDKAQITKAENMGSEMAKSAADTIEELAASVFNNGFSTSYTSYGDSKPLFSTDHTRPDGGTAQSNASANSIVFSDEALETALVAFRGQKNKRGRLVRTRPDVLLVPPALEKEAIHVTKSEKRSGTADNDKNVYNMRSYYGGMLDIIVWEYLGSAAGGSDTAWYLLDSDLHKITWKWAKKPTVTRDEYTGKQNDTLYFLSMFYASYGWSDWVGAWGSQGTGAAYSD